MHLPDMQIAELEDEQLAKVKALEEELGKVIVAMRPYYPVANLNKEQVERLQDLEQELGVVLLAYTKT